MRSRLLLLALVACAPLLAQQDPAKEILAIERAAMDGMQKGDSSAMLKALAPEVTYFHAVAASRLEGFAAVKQLVDSYGGRPLFDRYEIRSPKVQVAGDVAVLTYDFVTVNGGREMRWNATQVYQRRTDGWKVIHSHFAPNQPNLGGVQ